MEQLISRLVSLGLFKFLGIAAIVAFIWFTGPFIEPLRPVSVRLIVIAVVTVMYLAYVLIRVLLRRKKEKKLADDLAQTAGTGVDPARDRSSEEIATLKAKFDEALQVLRKSGKGKHGQGSLYSLPWYMIIGPPGAGKTTLLVNSGLQFPLAQKMGLSKLQGVGGTRFCDWWFTDEAVIVDTAGRYTTQDSDEKVDNAAWTGFLKMLRKNRKRRPINGIIVAISIDELARESEVDRERSASAVTQRIQELYELLGVRFPVYVMFTKCDLLSGFMEFFGDLDRHERETVWGTTFEVNSEVLEHLDAEYQLLQTQLQSRLVQRLQQERDPHRRNLIYNFPNLFNSAKPLVTEFVERIYKPSRFTTTPLLRGIYFTSGTQEGTPFNRLISQLARNFSLSNVSSHTGSSQGKSFFIKDLLSKVIFRESGLAGANLKAERLFALLRTSGFVAVTVVPLVLTVLWWISHSENKNMIEKLRVEAESMGEQIKFISPQNDSLLSVLPALNEARELTSGYAERSESVPLSMTFGLYQGAKLAENSTLPAYRRLLENAFLSRLLMHIERRLAAPGISPEAAYPALKTYLMLGDDERLDPAFVSLWISSELRRDFGGDVPNEQYEQLMGHLNALLELRPFRTPFELDANLVETVRGILQQTSPAQRAYAIVKSELLTQGMEFTVAGVGGPEAVRALIRTSGEHMTRGVPAMFTPDGYYSSFVPTQLRVISEQEDEFWVFRTEAMGAASLDTADLLNQVSSLYYQDYIDTWWRFLEDIRVRPFDNFVEAAETLRIISGDDSPLVLILKGAVANTKLAPDLPLDDGVVATTPLPGTNQVADPTVVDKAFQALDNFVSGQNSQPSPLDGIKQDIKELHFYLSDLARGGPDAAISASQQGMASVVDKIQISASYAPKPISDWVSSLADQSRGLIAGRATNALNERWRSEVVPFCDKAISHRYPFAKASESEVSLQDFGRFFGPGGILDLFFQKNLAAHVNTAVLPWRVRPNVSDIVRISPATLRELETASDIRQSFFSGGNNTPSIGFELTPVRMDPVTTHFQLNLDGQRISYSHDALRSTSVSWPGGKDFGQVQIQFSMEGSIVASKSMQGAWAWFRLLDESSIQAGSVPEQFRLTFSLGDHWISFDLKASSAYNPFNLSQLQSFKCTPNL